MGVRRTRAGGQLPRPGPPSTTMRWPVMNPGAFGGQKAHGVGDVAGSSHPPGGHRGQIGLPDLGGNVGVAFHGDESGRDRVHGDPERG